ncbi:mannose-1-phosphate guanylyltransferase/mannose-1-phosphate guanylyltransferase/mannose-6-phosphate isomerase [Sinobacterium caligoides]|uniref:mannose-1-phosphate guanylyltransferase n=1 Tax=Sinobacterium caligoides TaxID=933926 RepID=A0A3N2D5D7_9GAMM|nr:mannose-1-phosphate guanylyltransferase/mannose-6-phosphate isomerase [Sinobacterium caligoides]ROR94848.1 mannose-1-phosphate guanylyltransferase/mannose-1-phosphate guanylyltransferase/mannose-6-phosphate isomerase [Sinobacterium caligoides]
MIHPVLLCGGVGSRLWPVSRGLFPKQFIRLMSDQWSMLQQTLGRLEGLELAPPIVVCNEEHRFLVAEQLRQMGVENAAIILEPVGRNTAPAVALAAMAAQKNDAEAVLLVLPADHVIKQPTIFHQAVMQAVVAAEQGHLATFGVVPEGPETGYGYIERGVEVLPNCYKVTRFVEKPDLPTAKSYVRSGKYAWNSGMFVFRAEQFCTELGQFSPEIFHACRKAYDDREHDLSFIRIDRLAFEQCPSDSIDYALMEKTNNAVVIALAAGWSDVGSWSSLWQVSEHDDDNNVCRGDVITHNVSNSYLRSGKRLVAAVGVDNLVVVETEDAILVASKDHVQDVKHIVSRLKSEVRPETDRHTQVFRPWGSYQALVADRRFQVKRIIVSPGQTLSLQMHHHRAEHWVVVSGTAHVTCGEKEFILTEDQSTYIPLGHQHRLSNPGVIPLELIEVQSGSYLGEDDIVRFEDIYGRSK